MNYTQTKKWNAVELRQRKLAKWRKRDVRKDVNVGDVAEGCDLHIGLVTAVDRHSGDLTIKSFFTGKSGNCDLYHCGVVVQSAKQIKQKMDLYNAGGIEAIKALWDERVRKGTY